MHGLQCAARRLFAHAAKAACDRLTVRRTELRLSKLVARLPNAKR